MTGQHQQLVEGRTTTPQQPQPQPQLQPQVKVKEEEEEESGQEEDKEEGEQCRTVSGDLCVFPFTYRGVVHNTCTKVGDQYHKAWCSLKTDSTGRHVSNGGHWGYCKPTVARCSSAPPRKKKQKRRTAVKAKVKAKEDDLPQRTTTEPAGPQAACAPACFSLSTATTAHAFCQQDCAGWVERLPSQCAYKDGCAPLPASAPTRTTAAAPTAPAPA